MQHSLSCQIRSLNKHNPLHASLARVQTLALTIQMACQYHPQLSSNQVEQLG
uniref:Uncharacterized protein n=1 Tax=Arundo donax TaxID=35708 RepID=A0A0A9BQI5_ARUDO